MKTELPHARARALPAVCVAVNRARLLDTAVRLVAEPSPTRSAGPAADALAAILTEDGFTVERVVAGHAASPAVVVRFDSGRAGRTLQFDGHLDTVHLPFVPPAVVGHRLTGSGSADMKGGIAAAVEALRAVRDAGGLAGGSILLTAHDLHESPWGDGSQLDALIRSGCVGDAVLIPEYFNSALPVIGRGGFIWAADIRRPGPPVHEVYRPDEPSPIAAGAKLVARLERLDGELSRNSDPLAGASSAFVGTIRSGTIYNEYPQSCRLEGTRRWLPGTKFADADREFRDLCGEVARETRTTIDVETRLMRDAFLLDTADPFVGVFQTTCATLCGGALLPGGKPFVDDGNTFHALAGVPAITHGPTAGGAHTVAEWVDIDDLVRVARLYALIASIYCPDTSERSTR